MDVGSAGVSAYQKLLRPVLGSKCRWYPSDSQNAQLLAQRCSPLKSIFGAYGRFLIENDASHLGYPILNGFKHLQFFDRVDCEH